jgi:hypothetical protein
MKFDEVTALTLRIEADFSAHGMAAPMFVSTYDDTGKFGTVFAPR